MRSKILLGIGLVFVAIFVLGTTNVNFNAETKPPNPVGIVFPSK